MDNISKELKEQIIYRFGLNYPRIKTCLESLSETEVWLKPNENSNSIANLILHLCGNITQYVISGLGGLADNRERSLEFTRHGGLNISELNSLLKKTSDNSIEIINTLGIEDLLKIYSVQGSDISGIAILIHVTEHFSYHTGQIVSLTKALKNIDTGFYKGMDLNKKNRTGN